MQWREGGSLGWETVAGRAAGEAAADPGQQVDACPLGIGESLLRRREPADDVLHVVAHGGQVAARAHEVVDATRETDQVSAHRGRCHRTSAR